MPTLLKANIITSDGGRFQAPVANLSFAGLFLRTTEDLRFGQKLTLHLLGFSIPGEVLFVSSDPVGAVVAIAPPSSARPLLDVRSRTVEVLQSDGPGQPWAEDTDNEPSGPTIQVDDLIQSPASLASTDAGTDPWTVDTALGDKRESTAVPILEPEEAPLELLEAWPEPPALNAPDLALDPQLFASAVLDDSTDLPPARSSTPVPAAAPPHRPRGSSTLAGAAQARPTSVPSAPARTASAASGPAATAPRPLAIRRAPSVPAAPATESSGSLPAVARIPEPLPPPRSVSARAGTPPKAEPIGSFASFTANIPEPIHTRSFSSAAPVLTPDPPSRTASKVGAVLIPDPPKASGPVLVPDPPAPEPSSAALPRFELPTFEAAAPAEAPPEAPVEPAPPDPTLPELEGDTVSFESAENFRTQFRNNLIHGGLVVRAKPLTIGTQRLLAISVPGFELYTVSARVIFNEPGKLGFMLDSFNLHKARLQQMAEPSSQPLA